MLEELVVAVCIAQTRNGVVLTVYAMRVCAEMLSNRDRWG
jgi:hypothetical protein